MIVAELAIDDGSAVADEIAAAGGEAHFLKLDVASEADWRSAVSETFSA